MNIRHKATAIHLFDFHSVPMRAFHMAGLAPLFLRMVRSSAVDAGDSRRAGSNAGAVLAGVLFKTPSLTYPQAFLILGVLIACCSAATFAVQFSERDELAARR